MNTEENMIPVEPLLRNFKQYLDANSRCILSAKFGDGKSYFINRFVRKYRKDYLFVPLYPVNYQVMENKDIFELIKRDMLIKLLSNEEININGIDLSTVSLLYNFFKDETDELLASVLDFIPSINVFGVNVKIGKVIEKLKEIGEKFEGYKKQFNGRDKVSETYIESFNKIQGSIYEFDAISLLICNIISEYKKENTKKKVVLLIEDLDRMDPAHIFRILNVFSAHFDRFNPSLEEFTTTQGDNKFCLDKVVMVCDINNIRNIYSHVYGAQTDFMGYIGKFINNYPFHFSLKSEMKNYIITKLLHANLTKYTLACDRLVDLILNHIDNFTKLDYSLRIIKERIETAEHRIKDYSIPLVKRLNGLYLHSYADYTQFLALLKTFEIEFSEFLVDAIDFRDCMIQLVDPFWALVGNLMGNFCFELTTPENLVCRYSQRNGYHREDAGATFSVEKENEILTHIELRTNDAKGVGLEIYKRLNLITEYLLKEVII